MLANIFVILYSEVKVTRNRVNKTLQTIFMQATLTNVYGPTECTCICSVHKITEEDFNEIKGLPPLGNLNQNFDYCILDEKGSRNHTGELCLIGPNVASGTTMKES